MIKKESLSLIFLFIYGICCAMEKETTPLKIVTANINLMPKNLNLVTIGDPVKRAEQIAKSLLTHHKNTDIYYLQEMYDDESSDILIGQLKKEGFDYYPGPSKKQLEEYWKKKYCYVLRAAHNSGQGIFIRKNRSLSVESYDILPFIDEKIEGIGLLEAYVPKGVIHIKLSQEGKSISILGHHLQAEIGFFALARLIQGEWHKLPETIVSDFVHLQPFQKLREKYPNYLETLRSRQLQATMSWIESLKKKDLIADQVIHLGDFNLIAGSPEYSRLLTTLNVVPASDRTDLVTLGNSENSTWSSWIRPLYKAACKYVNNYGWMDLVLVNSILKNKVQSVTSVDLKDQSGRSVTDHESVVVTLSDVFKKISDKNIDTK